MLNSLIATSSPSTTPFTPPLMSTSETSLPADGCHPRLGKEDSRHWSGFWVCHPDTRMENADVFHFVQHARPGIGSKTERSTRPPRTNSKPQNSKPRGRGAPINVTSAANSDHQRA